ncbi:MAG: gliding motility-associated C-terminal domain-containing protein [Bacteroidetes bacterium]|nr:gliding motility-associated C-terminal domain-containing protein [Bacteroidota bacterium]
MKYKFLFSFFVYCLLPTADCFSQPQHNFWYFGRHAGLDFSSGSPVAVYGKSNTDEGVSGISSAAGALQFYIGTDTTCSSVINIWDATHTYMQNGTGLYSNCSTSQSTIVVPHPGCNSNKYFIFQVEGSTGGCAHGCGAYYSEVDMSLNSGLGAVTTKNNALYSCGSPPCVTEQVTATPNANGIDYWVLIHEYSTNNFRVYPVTSSGVGAAVVFSVGPVYFGSGGIIGYTKFNLAGTKIAAGGGGSLYLYDFNNATGVISNPQDLALGSSGYGVEFSPNGNYLYCTNFFNLKIFQYDLTSGNIPASITQVDVGSFYNKGALQLAPDGKIYAAVSGQAFVGAINSPNSLYPATNYVDNVVPLVAGTLEGIGLPNFLASYNSSGGGLSATSTANNILCNGGNGSATANASGGNSPYTYSWNLTGQTTSTATGLAAGNYTVTITDAGGCSATDTVSISQPTALSTTITSTNSCGSSGSATIAVAGGSGSYTYNWNPTGQTTSTATGLSSGNYSVTITDGNGCTSTASATINSGNPPTATISASNTTVCSGSSVTLTASGGGTYSWSTSQTTTSISTTATATATYSVVVDSSGCTDTASITINVIATPTATISPNISVCAGQTVTLNASGGNNYSWNTGQTTSTITATATAAATYSVIVSNGNCSDTASTSVSILSSPSPTITGNNLLCTGDTTTLIANGGNSYSWNTGSTSTSINVNPTSSTTYTLTATNSSGCSASITVTVTVSPPPIANATSATVCQGTNAILTASGGGNYSWSTGATTSSITTTTAGNYSVIVSVGTCSDTATASVTVNPNPTATASSNTTITQGNSATLTAGGGGNYSWSDGSNGATISVSPNATTVYCVTVVNSFGCNDSACVTVTVEPIDCSNSDNYFLPNAFSPNGDNENDFLRIHLQNILCVKDFKLIIYDRWGEKIFESVETNFQWDGTYKSKKLDTAVFVYILEINYKDGSQMRKSGNVTLVK